MAAANRGIRSGRRRCIRPRRFWANSNRAARTRRVSVPAVAMSPLPPGPVGKMICPFQWTRIAGLQRLEVERSPNMPNERNGQRREAEKQPYGDI